jgi:hypothetical protein
VSFNLLYSKFKDLPPLVLIKMIPPEKYPLWAMGILSLAMSLMNCRGHRNVDIKIPYLQNTVYAVKQIYIRWHSKEIQPIDKLLGGAFAQRALLTEIQKDNK